jgi:MFS family permease
MQVVFAPMWGRLSETHGRKPILLVGVTGYGLGFAIFGVVATLGARHALGHGALLGGLLGARLLGGALSSATLPIAQAWAADLSERAHRAAAMGIIGAAFGLAMVFGPAIGAACAHVFGLLAPVWLSLGLALVNVALVATTLREPPRKREVEAATELLPVARKVPALLAVAFVATFSSVAMEQTISFAFEDRLHLAHEETPTWVGLGLVAYGLVAVFAQGLLVRRLRIAPRTLMLAGLPIAFVGMSLLSFVQTYPLLVLALSLQGLGQGLVMPGVSSALSLRVGDGEQGAVAGLTSAALGVGRLLGPVLGSHLYGLSGALPYQVSSALIALVLLFLLAARDVAAHHEPVGGAR